MNWPTEPEEAEDYIHECANAYFLRLTLLKQRIRGKIARGEKIDREAVADQVRDLLKNSLLEGFERVSDLNSDSEEYRRYI